MEEFWCYLWQPVDADGAWRLLLFRVHLCELLRCSCQCSCDAGIEPMAMRQTPRLQGNQLECCCCVLGAGWARGVHLGLVSRVGPWCASGGLVSRRRPGPIRITWRAAGVWKSACLLCPTPIDPHRRVLLVSMTMTIASSMAEVFSALPTSGGIYYCEQTSGRAGGWGGGSELRCLATCAHSVLSGVPANVQGRACWAASMARFVRGWLPGCTGWARCVLEPAMNAAAACCS